MHNETTSQGVGVLGLLLALLTLVLLLHSQGNRSLPGETAHRSPFVSTLPPRPYFEDPEAESELWDDYVWADSDQLAQRRCQAIADNNGISLVNVIKVGRNRYQCTFRG